MRRILSIVILFTAFSTQAVEFKISFYDLLDKGDLELAEIFLEEWESNDSGNPDLFLAKYNLLMSKAFQPEETSNSNSDPILDNPLAVLEPNDSILQLAIGAIKKGVGVFPNRLDFRLAEAQAYQYANDMESISKSGINILEHSRNNGCRWYWSDGVALNAEEGLEKMLQGLHSIENALMHNSFQDALLGLNLKYYPTDAEALLIKSMALLDAEKYVEARSCLEFAHENHPDDGAVMFYLGVVYSKMGDKEKEDEILKKIVESDKADEHLKETAKAILEGQDSNLKEIDLYQFEFNFLRNVANTCSPSVESIEFLSNKDDEIFYVLEQLGYYLPDEHKEIKIKVIGKGDDGIVVWTMPEPKEMPLARYIAFVPDKEANHYRLYTLERSINWDGEGPAWILGYSYKDGHSNFGDVPYPSTPEKFVKEVLKVINSTK